jgi:hypothetical protein
MPNNIQEIRKYFDPWSIFVLLMTFLLFSIALFVKGLTHDILLETGVFLVSVKLIMMGYKNNFLIRNLENQIQEIKEILQNKKDIL